MPGFYITAFSAEHRSQTRVANDQGVATFQLVPGEWRIRVEVGDLKQITHPIIRVQSNTAQQIPVILDPLLRCFIRP
jgi:hypothetical protein